MKSLAYRIAELLEKRGYSWPGGPENAKIRRTYAGRHQRSDGAWSWYLDAVQGLAPMSIGSQWKATTVVNPKNEVVVYITPWGELELIVEKESE